MTTTKNPTQVFRCSFSGPGWDVAPNPSRLLGLRGIELRTLEDTRVQSSLKGLFWVQGSAFGMQAVGGSVPGLGRRRYRMQ